MHGERLKADAALVVATASWGATFILIKNALPFADPLSFLLVRFGLAFVLLLPLAGRAAFRRDTLRAGAALGLLLAGTYLAQTVALAHTTAMRSAFVVGLYVLLVPLLSAVFLRQRPGRWSVMGSVLATVGLYLLTQDSATPELGLSWRGDGLSLVTAFVYAAYVLLTGKFARRIPTLPLVAVQLAVCLALFATLLPWRHLHWQPVEALWVGVAIGVGANTCVLLLQTWAQARTSAVRASVIFALEPAFAALFASIVGGERLGVSGWVGGGLIFIGVLASELGSGLTDERPTD